MFTNQDKVSRKKTTYNTNNVLCFFITTYWFLYCFTQFCSSRASWLVLCVNLICLYTCSKTTITKQHKIYNSTYNMQIIDIVAVHMVMYASCNQWLVIRMTNDGYKTYYMCRRIKIILCIVISRFTFITDSITESDVISNNDI